MSKHKKREPTRLFRVIANDLIVLGEIRRQLALEASRLLRPELAALVLSAGTGDICVARARLQSVQLVLQPIDHLCLVFWNLFLLWLSLVCARVDSFGGVGGAGGWRGAGIFRGCCSRFGGVNGCGCSGSRLRRRVGRSGIGVDDVVSERTAVS